MRYIRTRTVIKTRTRNITRTIRYFKITKHKKIEVTKRKFLQWLKYKLKKTPNPSQYHNFVFCKLPNFCLNSFQGQLTGTIIPVDYKLANILKCFWKHKIRTTGIHQGYNFYNKEIDNGYIILKNINNAKKTIMKLFGKENIKYHSQKIISKMYIQNPNKPTKKIRKKERWENYEYKLNQNIIKYPNKLHLIPRLRLTDLTISAYELIFNPNIIEWMNKKLDVEIPKYENVYPGDLLYWKKLKNGSKIYKTYKTYKT